MDVVIGRAEEVRRLNASLQTLNTKLLNRDRELRQLADVTAHDLQEPLRKIQSFSDLIRGGEADRLSEDGRLFLERINAAAARMSALVSGMMSYTDVLVGEGSSTSVDLGRQLRTVLEDVKGSDNTDEATVTLHGDEDILPEIYGDPGQLRRLFRHVLENAFKFRHPERPPHVHVRVGTQDAGVQRIRVEIAEGGTRIVIEFPTKAESDARPD